MNPKIEIPSEANSDIIIKANELCIPQFNSCFKLFLSGFWQALKTAQFRYSKDISVEDYDLITHLIEVSSHLAKSLAITEEIHMKDWWLFFLEAGMAYGNLLRCRPDPILGHKMLGFQFLGKVIVDGPKAEGMGGTIEKHIKISYEVLIDKAIDNHPIYGYVIKIGYTDEYLARHNES